MTTFAQLKTEAATAKNAVELFRIAKASNDKLQKNIQRATFMSMMNGRAVEAGHYFENVIPGWAKINDEIHQMLSAKMSQMNQEQVIATITEAMGA